MFTFQTSCTQSMLSTGWNHQWHYKQSSKWALPIDALLKQYMKEKMVSFGLWWEEYLICLSRDTVVFPSCYQSFVWLEIIIPQRMQSASWVHLLYVFFFQMMILRDIMQGDKNNPKIGMENNSRPTSPLNNRPVRTNIDYPAPVSTNEPLIVVCVFSYFWQTRNCRV